MTPTADSALGNFVDHLTAGFTPELAKHFAELPVPNPEFQVRLDYLASGANEGILSQDESEEYARYSEYMDFVALLRLKARLRATTPSG